MIVVSWRPVQIMSLDTDRLIRWPSWKQRGSIDRTLNVSMNLETLQEIGNQSYVSGTASGVAPGMGIVEVRVGGGVWKGSYRSQG